MRLIQIFAREKEKYAQFEKKSDELFAANWREVMTFAVFRPSIYFVSVLAMILVIGTGSASVLNGTLSLGTLFIFITYISSFFEPIQELAEQFGTLQSSLASAEKVFSVLDEKPEIVNPPKPVDVSIRGRIEFQNVWFAYEKNADGSYNYVLKDVSFVIEPGERGTLFIFITYISSFFEPIQELAEQFGTLQSSLASAEKVFSILDEKPEIVNPPKPVDVSIRGRIEFQNVWFAYEKNTDGSYNYVLKDVSFVIKPGERVAFVGATGAGKSSILNLIGRYFDIQKGHILIDGVDIKDIDTDVLRRAF